jgi:hypothetical protein
LRDYVAWVAKSDEKRQKHAILINFFWLLRGALYWIVSRACNFVPRGQDTEESVMRLAEANLTLFLIAKSEHSFDSCEGELYSLWNKPKLYLEINFCHLYARRGISFWGSDKVPFAVENGKSDDERLTST